MKIKTISGIILAIILFAGISSAAYVNDGGITIDGNKAEFYTDYALTSNSYIYNEAGGTGETDGWVPVRAVKERTVQYQVASLTPGGTVTFSFRGTIIGKSDPALIYDLVIGTNTTGFIKIMEELDEIRVGAKVSSSGSATIDLIGKFPGM